MAVKLESGHCEISEDVPSFSVGEQFTNYSEFESKLNSRLALTNEKLRIGVGSTKMTVSCGKKEKEQQPRDDIVYRYVHRYQNAIDKMDDHNLGLTFTIPRSPRFS